MEELKTFILSEKLSRPVLDLLKGEYTHTLTYSMWDKIKELEIVSRSDLEGNGIIFDTNKNNTIIAWPEGCDLVQKQETYFQLINKNGDIIGDINFLSVLSSYDRLLKIFSK